MDSATFCGNRIYTATFNAEPLNYADFEQTVRKMMGSLRITT
jgi:hypothetical protein